MGILDLLFGPKVNYKELFERGALVIDVRTAGEFQGGHVKNSTNIPLDQIKKRVQELKKKKKPLILCCASGMRSGSAASILKSEGIECYNGGSWAKVQKHTTP